ncbi:MAG: hypothetical protein JWN39_1650 [Ilumatobacteraceae bacterium]|nr:hypothetical protein [Ilumatobacteraceae bacterium]
MNAALVTTSLGWIGSVFCVASIVQKNQARFRALNLVACLVLIAFNFANGAWSGVLLNTVVAIINIRQLLLLRAAARDAQVPATRPAIALCAPVRVADVREERELVSA